MGKDWIPRLTLDTFERLRDEMVSLLSISCSPLQAFACLQIAANESMRRLPTTQHEKPCLPSGMVTMYLWSLNGILIGAPAAVKHAGRQVNDNGHLCSRSSILMMHVFLIPFLLQIGLKHNT